MRYECNTTGRDEPVMKRIMPQVYVRDAAGAIELYKAAFDAEVKEIHHTPDGRVLHSELDVDGYVIAVADREEGDGAHDVTGNVMQFCLHMEPGREDFVKKAYSVLSEKGTVRFPLGDAGYSQCTTDLVDAFGVRWCIFTA